MALDSKPFTVTHVTLIAGYIAILIDDKDIKDMTIDRALEVCRNGEIFSHLKNLDGGDFDNGFFENKPVFISWFNGRMKDQAFYLGGRVSKKTGIENSGLCLLLTMCLELISDWSDLRKRDDR